MLFTKEHFEVAVTWKFRQVKTSFSLSIYAFCVIYKVTCSCRGTCIGKILHNASVRSEEYNKPTTNLKSAKHLENNFIMYLIT